ncbi:MAG: TAT-variant-translocated molybdopterin oxidoreductase, partial [Candidatus Eisenbacteria bacterium]|nr:TAT-variant-translocated molybdopterin oxidoreductase [Candidatus Eisenbacteria bacterium]
PAGAAMSGLSLDTVRERLAGKTGRVYWRSLEELAEAPEFTDLLHREFPRQASEWTDAVSRREFLHVMAASLALAGLAGCGPRNPAEKILPYVKAPEGFIPGKPLYYASTLLDGGAATGVLVESHMGRPTKIEGNVRHPASLGATSAVMQASILTMYDPDRSQVVTSLEEVRPWNSFVQAMTQALAAQKAVGGSGLRILTETVNSPTTAAQLQKILADYPGARWHQYEPVNRDNVVDGARMAFGEAVDTHFNLLEARVIVSLDRDFLFEGPGHLRYVRDFARGRRVVTPGKAAHGADNGHEPAAHHDAPSGTMSRLYVAESAFTNTGARADHRLAVRPDMIEPIVREIARQVGVTGALAGGSLDANTQRFVAGLTADLRSNAGAGAVLVGDHQPAAVHALVHAINAALGNVGGPVVHTAPIAARPENQLESIRTLVADMDAGRVQLLLILGGNPIYTAPAEMEFADRLGKVGFRVHLGLYEDETSELCHWHVPETHPLEAWSDARAYDGTMSIVQPLIAPLYEGKSVHEFLAVLTGETARSGYELVREAWKAATGGANFEAIWSETVHDGFLTGSAAIHSQALIRDAGTFAPAGVSTATVSTGPVLAFRPDPSIGDGRHANNGWLQELSKPLTRLTWENVALISPVMAQSLGLMNGHVVELGAGGATTKAPVWILPGQPAEVITVHLGFGRTRAGRVGTGVGFDANKLRSASSFHWTGGVTIKKTGKKVKLACTQDHQSMEGRHLVRSASLSEHQKNPHWAHEVGTHEPPRDLTLYKDYPYNGNAWGLAIDLTSCVGCNACVIACQAENNIPVVGKSQVWRGREMAWLRIDRYFEGDLDDPALHYQPVMCMQCENAPCETVCPVAATVHNSEGLNDMAYNRCVGTRYCSNNCPYKVRRFNFMQYTDLKTPSMKLLNNPDVTVRTRGVMEKCTYCVQRINTVRIESRKANRPIRDGEIVTACQQACPAEAIVFGDINDPNSRVAKLKADTRNYGLLTDLNTRPRTTYLARLENPNPDMGKV